MDPATSGDLSNKNLLVITPSYPNKDNTYITELFVKNQLEPLKNYFNTIHVIAPVLFSFKRMSKDKLCENYDSDNIKVYYPRCYYIPIFYFSQILIDNRLRVVENLIKNENINFDLIHAHFTWPSSYIGTKLKEKYDRPLVVTIHENSEWFDKELSMNHPLINDSWKNADALLRVNKKDIPVLKQFNENVFSTLNGYSSQFKKMEKEKCREQLNLPSDSKIIFSLGWLIERKGFNFLIDAMKIIKEERNDVFCFIGGSVPAEDEFNNKTRAKLEKQINDLNLQDHVKLIGLVPDESLPLWMNACDLFVLPSLSESFGVVQVEAMACGKPVVATRNGGSEEILISDDYGLLVEPANPQDLAEKIVIALNKEWDSGNILNYSQQYQWENIAEQIQEIYSTVLCK
ncbi:glycosyltransferase [Methanolobus sp. ZRKC2]|uniref:glycosyltransferase n=1 Tax=Methanolobus sp. ZRKC2 TaxID=3125783 RepID=UPI00324669B2